MINTFRLLVCIAGIVCILPHTVFPKVEAGFRGGLNSTTNSLQAYVTAHGRYKDEIFDLQLDGGYGFLSLADRFTSEHNAVFDMDYRLTDWFEAYLMTGYRFRNEVYAIESGLGGKYTYFRDTLWDLSLSLMPMYTWDLPAAGGQATAFRLSFRHRLIVKFFDNKLQLRSAVFYKPDALDFRDYIVQAAHVFSLKVTDLVSVTAGHDFYYRRRDYYSKLSLGFTFEFDGKK
ncbi:MAG: hypothetical protein HZC28_05570 [Spirochaetes bacterium]|nr:hypothetical protein [Spirochaetota bacterium]